MGWQARMPWRIGVTLVVSALLFALCRWWWPGDVGVRYGVVAVMGWWFVALSWSTLTDSPAVADWLARRRFEGGRRAAPPQIVEQTHDVVVWSRWDDRRRARVMTAKVRSAITRIEPRKGAPGTLVTGDSVFDADVEVDGAGPAARALLDRKVRAKLRTFVAEGGTLRDGVLVRRQPDPGRATWPEIGEVLDVARMLGRPVRDPAAELEQMVRTDPRREVQRLALIERVALSPADPDLRPLMQQVVRRERGPMRWEAAAWLNDDRVWSQMVADPDEQEGLRVEALRRLVGRRGLASDAALRAALSGPAGLRQAAVGALRGVRGAEFAAALRGIVERAFVAQEADERLWREDEGLAVGLVTALAEHVQALDHDRLVTLACQAPEDAAVLALRALAPFATPATVTALLPLLDGRGARARAAEQVAAGVRSKIGAGGALSIVSDGGELSVASDGGELSVVLDGGELSVVSDAPDDTVG